MSSAGHISVASANLDQVVVSLLEKLDSRELKVPNEVQASPPENGIAATVVILTAVMIEGYVNRLKHFEDIGALAPASPDASDAGRRLHVLDWLATRLPSDLHAKSEELFCVRDVIAHAHTWEAETAPGPLRFVGTPTLHERYGDNRLKRVIDRATRKTKILRLNLFPTRIWRRDAYIAFQVMITVIEALEPIDPTGHRLDSNWGHLAFKGHDLTLPQIARALHIPGDC